MKNKTELTIGFLAKQADVTVETVKFYEKEGLVPKPPKPMSGFRTYPKEHVTRILFIKRARELGFTLREIKELLKLNVDKKSACAQAVKRADEKVLEIETKIKDLQKMKKSLIQIRELCAAKTPMECPIERCFNTTKGGCQ